MEENMKYKKPEIKIYQTIDISENIGPVQTGYARVMWVQTDPINVTYNQQVYTNQLADAVVFRLEKNA